MILNVTLNFATKLGKWRRNRKCSFSRLLWHQQTCYCSQNVRTQTNEGITDSSQRQKRDRRRCNCRGTQNTYFSLTPPPHDSVRLTLKLLGKQGRGTHQMTPKHTWNALTKFIKHVNK